MPKELKTFKQIEGQYFVNTENICDIKIECQNMNELNNITISFVGGSYNIIKCKTYDEALLTIKKIMED